MQFTPCFRRNACRAIAFGAGVMLLAGQPLPAADAPAAAGIVLSTQERMILAQRRQCERRAGPFATQDAAWRRWRQARNQGMAVSRGVVPCRDRQGYRGYCYFVFYAC